MGLLMRYEQFLVSALFSTSIRGLLVVCLRRGIRRLEIEIAKSSAYDATKDAPWKKLIQKVESY